MRCDNNKFDINYKRTCAGDRIRWHPFSGCPIRRIWLTKERCCVAIVGFIISDRTLQVTCCIIEGIENDNIRSVDGGSITSGSDESVAFFLSSFTGIYNMSCILFIIVMRKKACATQAKIIVYVRTNNFD